MATDCPSLQNLIGIVDDERRLRRRASDRPQPVLLTANPAFENVNLADEFGDESRARLLVDFAGRRRPVRYGPGP